MKLPFTVGQKVIDDLTGHHTTVIGISYKHGKCGDPNVNHYHCFGVWVEDPYLDGARHPWELTEIHEEVDDAT